jgi:hypothetical protein
VARSISACTSTHEQAFHLAGVRVIDIGQRAHGAAARQLAIDEGQQQRAGRRRVFAGQAGQFGVEVLEAQVDTQAAGVFTEDFSRGVEQRRRIGHLQRDLGRAHRGQPPSR